MPHEGCGAFGVVRHLVAVCKKVILALVRSECYTRVVKTESEMCDHVEVTRARLKAIVEAYSYMTPYERMRFQLVQSIRADMFGAIALVDLGLMNEEQVEDLLVRAFEGL